MDAWRLRAIEGEVERPEGCCNKVCTRRELLLEMELLQKTLYID